MITKSSIWLFKPIFKFRNFIYNINICVLIRWWRVFLCGIFCYPLIAYSEDELLVFYNWYKYAYKHYKCLFSKANELPYTGLVPLNYFRWLPLSKTRKCLNYSNSTFLPYEIVLHLLFQNTRVLKSFIIIQGHISIFLTTNKYFTQKKRFARCVALSKCYLKA